MNSNGESIGEADCYILLFKEVLISVQRFEITYSTRDKRTCLLILSHIYDVLVRLAHHIIVDLVSDDCNLFVSQ
jgi:hypothetical protein